MTVALSSQLIPKIDINGHRVTAPSHHGQSQLLVITVRHGLKFFLNPKKVLKKYLKN